MKAVIGTQKYKFSHPVEPKISVADRQRFDSDPNPGPTIYIEDKSYVCLFRLLLLAQYSSNVSLLRFFK